MPSREVLLGHRTYWAFQAAGWLAFAAVRLLAAATFDQFNARAILFQAGATTLGIAGTHAARLWIHRAGWKHLDWRALLPRVFIAALILSLLATPGFVYGAMSLFPRETGQIAPPLLFLITLVNSMILFCAWFAIYFTYHGWQSMQKVQIERLELANAVKEAELRALKGQMDPHFLFNALNTVRALIDENPARARDAVTQLANLLRSSLQAGQSQTVPLSQELQTVKSYLALEAIRHEARLRSVFDVAPDVLSEPVPPFLLQTLVENAVKYGISPRAEGGEIVCQARYESGALVLRITNPGRIAPRGASTGVGLRNAAQRLAHLFGPAATLRLDDSGGERVVAEVRIPPGARAAAPAAFGVARDGGNTTLQRP